MNRLHTSLLRTGGLRKLKKNMEIAFIVDLSNYSALFQKIIGNLSTYGLSTLVKHNLQIFPLILFVEKQKTQSVESYTNMTT